MTLLLVDSDILPYEIGFVMQKDGVSDWPVVKKGIDNRVEMIIEGARKYSEEPIDMVVFALSDPNGTFRQQIATILPYKGNRTKDKPVHWDGIRAYLRDRYDAEHLPLLEGDDALLIIKEKFDDTHNVIIASSDKDLRQVPGNFYSWPVGDNRPEKFESVSTLTAARNLWTQMLVGDRTDNILGLFGVGPSSAAVKNLVGCQSEKQMAAYVFKEYERRFGNYAVKFFVETYRLLKLIGKDYDPDSLDPETWQTAQLADIVCLPAVWSV